MLLFYLFQKMTGERNRLKVRLAASRASVHFTISFSTTISLIRVGMHDVIAHEVIEPGVMVLCHPIL